MKNPLSSNSSLSQCCPRVLREFHVHPCIHHLFGEKQLFSIAICHLGLCENYFKLYRQQHSNYFLFTTISTTKSISVPFPQFSLNLYILYFLLLATLNEQKIAKLYCQRIECSAKGQPAVILLQQTN